MPSFEWFRQLADVPGIVWQPPVAVDLDPHWTGAQPLIPAVEEADADYTFVTWIDASGNRLTDQMVFASPAEAVSRQIEEGETTLAVLTALSACLSLPGTRRDYFDALERGSSRLARLDDEDPTRMAWVEALLWLAVSLLRTGLEETLVPFDAKVEERSVYLSAAASPYRTLVWLYQQEGFLKEAAAVIGELEQLPAGVGQRQVDAESDPREAIAALEELLEVEELRR